MTAVVWVNPDPHWDEQIIRELTAGDEWTHHRHFNPVVSEGAVVVIPGQHHVNDADRLARWLEILPWSLVIVTSDEEALFPVGLLPRDERHVAWGQYHARPEFERVVPVGARPGTAEMVVPNDDERSMVWFAGQDTHERRHELISVLKEMAAYPSYGNVGWLATTGFQEGLTQESYLAALALTTIAPCPSGPHSLDSFRLYEALAAGALPIIETHTPHGDEGEFWHALLPHDDMGGIPCVDSWTELPTLVERFGSGPAWREKRDELQAWWQRYRARLKREFDQTIARLRES